MKYLSTETLWGLMTGLLLGAGVFGHALRLVILPSQPLNARHAVAASAVLLYFLAATLTFFRKKSGLWISIIGPVSGITMVTIAPNAHIDTFQFVLGIPQFLAIFLAAYLLNRFRLEQID